MRRSSGGPHLPRLTKRQDVAIAALHHEFTQAVGALLLATDDPGAACLEFSGQGVHVDHVEVQVVGPFGQSGRQARLLAAIEVDAGLVSFPVKDTGDK